MYSEATPKKRPRSDDDDGDKHHHLEGDSHMDQ